MIRTFLFDMGNVLAFFSHDRMCEQMGALCGRTREEIQALLIDSGKQWEFERGQLSAEEFHQWFEEATGQSVSYPDLVRAGADIFELNASIVPVLDTLKDRGHRLVLLSNTCISHFEFIWNEYEVLQRFDDFATSYKAGAIKPERPIFDLALSMIQCAPEDAFYTDDIADYVNLARELGIQAEVFTDTPTLIQHLSARDIQV